MGTQNPVTYMNFFRAGRKDTIAGTQDICGNPKPLFGRKKHQSGNTKCLDAGTKEHPWEPETPAGTKSNNPGKKDAREGNREQKIRSPKGTAEAETQYQPEQQEHNITQQATHPEPEPAPVPHAPTTNANISSRYACCRLRVSEPET